MSNNKILLLKPRGENGLPLHPLANIEQCMKSYEKVIIELPSDEEIMEQSWGYREVTKDMEIPPNEDWSNGAKWIIDKILNK